MHNWNKIKKTPKLVLQIKKRQRNNTTQIKASKLSHPMIIIFCQNIPLFNPLLSSVTWPSYTNPNNSSLSLPPSSLSTTKQRKRPPSSLFCHKETFSPHSLSFNIFFCSHSSSMWVWVSLSFPSYRLISIKITQKQLKSSGCNKKTMIFFRVRSICANNRNNLKERKQCCIFFLLLF